MSDLPPISLKIWEDKYRLKELDGTPVDETVDATWTRVAKALASCEGDSASVMAAAFYSIMASGEFSPAGRIIAGAGSNRNVTLSNCFTMGTIPDSMDGIFSHLKEAAITMQAGGGIGYDFSTLRPKGAPVKGVGADASGPLSFMDVWDAMCRTVMSAGSRRGAMMATMRCDHPDIESFIEAKRDPAKLRMFNLSVLVTDAFMAAVQADQPWRLHFENRHGETLVERTVQARALWDKIMEATYSYAEPGVIFIDRVNADHNLGYLETVATTNPCGEKPMGPYASCLLGSLNLAKFVVDPFTPNAHIDYERLHAVTRTAIRAMDNVIDVGRFPLEKQREKAQQDRQLGLGVTGLADALIMLGVTYGSEHAVRITDAIMQDICKQAYATSIMLAKEKGAFPTFDFAKMTEPSRFAGRMLTEKLKDSMKHFGIRNGLLLSIAPTGTISLFAGNVSSGIEPVFAASYSRKVLQPDGSKVEELVEDYAVKLWHDLGNEGLPPAYVDAQTLDPAAHVRMQAVAQRWVDSSISKTVNLPADISFEDFKGVYQLAYDMGCKGCTTYRPNETTGSILSVEPAAPREMGVDDLKRITNGWLSVKDTNTADARKKALKEWLAGKSAATVSELPKTEWGKLLDWISEQPAADFSADSVAAPELFGFHLRALTPSGEVLVDGTGADIEIEDWPEGDGMTVTAVIADVTTGPVAPGSDEPQERPDKLLGSTYKLKWPGSDHAIYIVINDAEDEATGRRRPFEVFINSKNMEHFAWTVALTRMISAIFRRPHDSRFVAEELKAVFDPAGGAWIEGKYVPSVLAAIGGVIERHMRDIGYLGGNEAIPPAAPTLNTDRAQLQALGRRGGASCPKCGSHNVKNEGGCLTCFDCTYSKCG